MRSGELAYIQELEGQAHVPCVRESNETVYSRVISIGGFRFFVDTFSQMNTFSSWKKT